MGQGNVELTEWQGLI